MPIPMDSQRVVPLLASVAGRRAGAGHVPPRLGQVMGLISGEMAALEGWLDGVLERDSACAVAAVDLIRAGGKRLRPALVLLSARVAPTRAVDTERTMGLAAAVEMLHAATLLHDDVIDEAPLRRGKPTARVAWGNPVSVIAGDLLLVRALSMVRALGDVRVDELMTETLDRLVLGEVEQLERRGRVEMDADTFERIAKRKTGSLFELAAVGGALLSGASRELADHLGDFSLSAGLAFQLDDDLLDLCASPEALGKAIGQDLATGSVSLPIADVLDRDASLRDALVEVLAENPGAPVPSWLGARISGLAHQTDALDRSRSLVRSHGRRAAAALQHLPSSPARHALEALVDLLIWRAAGQHEPSEARRIP